MWRRPTLHALDSLYRPPVSVADDAHCLADKLDYPRRSAYSKHRGVVRFRLVCVREMVREKAVRLSIS